MKQAKRKAGNGTKSNNPPRPPMHGDESSVMEFEDNALVKAAHIVSRLADYRPSPYVDELWRTFVGTLTVDPAVRSALLDPSGVDDAIARLPAGIAKYAWSATHTTFSPNMCRAGVKTSEAGKLYANGGYTTEFCDTCEGSYHVGAGYQQNLGSQVYGKVEYKHFFNEDAARDGNAVLTGVGVKF